FLPSTVVKILKSMRNEPRSAYSFFYSLKDRGFQHDVQCYLAIIEILSRRRLITKLDSLFIEILDVKNNDLSFEISELLGLLAKEGANGQFTVLLRAIDTLMKSYVSLGMFDEAVNTLFDTERYG
ncbi:hypothetical protein M569_10413, partial [Genlisea aurea]